MFWSHWLQTLAIMGTYVTQFPFKKTSKLVFLFVLAILVGKLLYNLPIQVFETGISYSKIFFLISLYLLLLLLSIS